METMRGKKKKKGRNIADVWYNWLYVWVVSLF